MINTPTIGNIKGRLQLPDYRFPCSAGLYKRDGWISFPGADTHYGYVAEQTELIVDDHDPYAGAYTLIPGMYFCVPGGIKLLGGSGLVITRHGWKGMLSIGGPLERIGRLRYIDGCSDSLLVGPPRVGDPCLNHLHFPEGILQTMHTHPSVRVGIITAGRGVCETPDGGFDLRPGMLWFLPEETPHRFKTDDSTMDCIAWHPDTDTGPSDEDHPMLNRTIVEGVSAKKIDSIRTTDLK